MLFCLGIKYAPLAFEVTIPLERNYLYLNPKRLMDYISGLISIIFF